MHLRENFNAPPGHGSENTWSEVSGRIDSITWVEAHRQANDQNHKSHSEGLQPLRYGVVVRVHNSQDTDYKSCCANYLERVTCKKRLWVRNLIRVKLENFLNDSRFHIPNEYLIKEAVDNGEMFSRVGGEDAGCGPGPSHIEIPRMIPKGIWRDANNEKKAQHIFGLNLWNPKHDSAHTRP